MLCASDCKMNSSNINITIIIIIIIIIPIELNWIILLVYFLFVCLFWLCPVHCPLLFVFVCCAVSVIGRLVVDSTH
jgi:hypothetical protein